MTTTTAKAPVDVVIRRKVLDHYLGYTASMVDGFGDIVHRPDKQTVAIYYQWDDPTPGSYLTDGNILAMARGDAPDSAITTEQDPGLSVVGVVASLVRGCGLDVISITFHHEEENYLSWVVTYANR